MKPDLDDIPTQKPDTIDEGMYDKPNAYDEETEPQTSLPAEVLEDLIVRSDFVDGKRPDIRTSDEPSATSSILTHVSPPTTSVSTTGFPVPTPSMSSASSITSGGSNATYSSRLALLEVLKKKPMEDMIRYDIRKLSLTRPQQHDIYFDGTKVKAYKKAQPHSYSWGFQNTLYRVFEGEEVKVAETRRRAFKKDITVQWKDFTENEEAIQTGAASPMLNITKSHLMFTYETEFEDYRIRWKRISLLSHDLVCEVKHQSEKWRVIAEFDSHRMGYLIQLGKLIIDKNALNLVEHPNTFEAHIVVVCCTLIDLMREVVEKAVGINKGGIVGSD
ncbi:hypothetical protein BY458DRAFT_436698 [Sporodiniella umbellata]|nr:hypothetical protein BY458DRAFT_436698 [Sporodiniella umbellata]